MFKDKSIQRYKILRISIMVQNLSKFLQMHIYGMD